MVRVKFLSVQSTDCLRQAEAEEVPEVKEEKADPAVHSSSIRMTTFHLL